MSRLLALSLIAIATGCGPTRSYVPVASVRGDDAFRQRLEELAAFGDERVGTMPMGPFMEGPDVEVAHALVAMATTEQLRALLNCDNPAIRANVARQVIEDRPADHALVALVADDETHIRVAGADDTGPNPDLDMTIREIVANELAMYELRHPTP